MARGDSSEGVVWSIHEAAYQGRLSLVHELLNKGICPNAPAAVGPGHRTWTSCAGPRPRPLHCVAIAWSLTAEHVQIARLLVERGADVEQSVIEDLEVERDGRQQSAALMEFLREAREAFESRVPFDMVHPSGKIRVRVGRRDDGLLAIETERWCVEDVPDYGMVWEGWTPIPGGVSLYRDLEPAKQAAIFELESLSAQAH